MNADQPAFPHPPVEDKHGVLISSGRIGMDIRTYLAGQALAGFCANPNTLVQEAGPKQRSVWSVKVADALIAELSKPAVDNNKPG